MSPQKSAFISTHPAIIAIWAALTAAASLLPAFPVIGTGATFNIGASLVPLAGILFGPWAGAIAAGIGSFLGQLIAPHTVLFGPLQFIISMFGAATAGLAMQRKWIWSLLLILGLGGVWYLFPTGQKAWATPLLYTLGLAGIAVGWIWGKDWLVSPNRGKMFAGVFCASVAGVVVTQAIGNLWALIMFALPPAIWFTVLPIAPIERFLFSLGAAIVGTPLLIGLPKISIPVGPMIYEEESEED
ncbi:MAG: hypothetical protein GYA34_01605 [Chloroflexi bacterium]|nr:hypothetical protein [Chloroflexota bacterium]